MNHVATLLKVGVGVWVTMAAVGLLSAVRHRRRQPRLADLLPRGGLDHRRVGRDWWGDVWFRLGGVVYAISVCRAVLASEPERPDAAGQDDTHDD